jgi:4-hydroxy-tetrahydrodipicolinate reductase
MNATGMGRRYRFLAVGLGPLGIRIATDVLARGLGDIVAAVDPLLAGQPLTSVIPAASADVVIGGRLDDVTVPVDVAIVATVSDLPSCAPTLRALLMRHISVVSTCEELSWPWSTHVELAGELSQLALTNNVHLLGTGVNPGFVMDALPIAITTVCGAVRRVEVHRIQDAGMRRLSFQAKIGATLTVEEFQARAAAGTVRHVGLRESAAMIASTLGLGFEQYEESIEPVIADQPMTCGLGAIAAGAVRGVHQEAQVLVGDREVISLVFHAAIGEPNPHDRVIVEGDPRIDLTIAGGVHGDIATSAVTLNAIVGLLDIDHAPGFHAMSTIPLRGCAPARR